MLLLLRLMLPLKKIQQNNFKSKDSQPSNSFLKPWVQIKLYLMKVPELLRMLFLIFKRKVDQLVTLLILQMNSNLLFKNQRTTKLFLFISEMMKVKISKSSNKSPWPKKRCYLVTLKSRKPELNIKFQMELKLFFLKDLKRREMISQENSNQKN